MYLRLIRLDRPVGTVLVLMPTLWSLWIASDGKPSIKLLAIFTIGSFLMRSAGCVINDIADRKIDPQVQRTKARPIASGEVTVKEGVILFAILSVLAFLLVMMLNPFTILLSVIGIFLAIVYPFTKRIISTPQLVLGISFGWGVIMAWVAVKDKIEFTPLLIFTANIFWSLAYDTIYALMDREDDMRIGVKSTAILFGQYVWLAFGLSCISFLLFLLWTGILAHLHTLYFISLLITGIFISVQVYQLKRNTAPEIAFKLFKNHGLFGTFIFIGIALDYLFR